MTIGAQKYSLVLIRQRMHFNNENVTYSVSPDKDLQSQQMIALRKHAYSNILKILPPKKMKIFR